MLLHQEEKKSDSCHLMVQLSERKTKGKPVLQKGEGESESEDMLFQNLKPPLANLAPPLADQTATAVVPTAPMPPTYSRPPVSPTYGDQLEVSMLTLGAQGPGLVSPSKTQQGTQFGLGATFGARQFPLCQYPIGSLNADGQPTVFLWMHKPFSTSDLFNWKNHNPTYQEDPLHMTELLTSIFAIHHPSWADIHTPMNMMLTGEERRMVVDKAREESHQLHLPDPDEAPEANLAVPIAEPDWDPNNGGMPLLEYYRRCVLVSLRKGVPRQKSLDKIQEIH